MRPVGDRAEQSGPAQDVPAEHHDGCLTVQTKAALRISLPADPDIAKQAIHHARHAAEVWRSVNNELGDVRCDADRENESGKEWPALHSLDGPAEVPKPHHIEQNVQGGEVNEDGCQQTPKLAFENALKTGTVWIRDE